ncbi:hypothetical protein L484_022773 [Morus notabilis]|uniref:Uncharacterized protein n=1 Tax=Morus notabilis TaxID=981085 RepID=W9SMP7_9ROSA|nr:hypothetical protein L484_022773 [Morus notabilis]
MNSVKKRELLLDDVGGSPPLKNASSFGNNLSGGAKGKRSERDPSSRNSVAKASNYKSERNNNPENQSTEIKEPPMDQGTTIRRTEPIHRDRRNGINPVWIWR